MATLDSTSFQYSSVHERSALRDVSELTIGFAAILAVLWLPTREQLIVGPIVLLTPLVLVLLRRPSLDQLGLGSRGLSSSLWILLASAALTILSILVARSAGTFHPLNEPNFSHVYGYVLWTMYQQFLMQDYFMPRLTRVLTSDAAIAVSAFLFAVAHLPNISLVLATLVWGAVSCYLFRRYRSLYVLGLAQGMLGLCFAVCVPDVLHHHMRVGLGYLHYTPLQ